MLMVNWLSWEDKIEGSLELNFDLVLGRFSMTNCWPSRTERNWPIMRATTSDAPRVRTAQ